MIYARPRRDQVFDRGLELAGKQPADVRELRVLQAVSSGIVPFSTYFPYSIASTLFRTDAR
jgi:hypothetical protein